MQTALIATAVTSVVVQSILLPILPWMYALLSPVHAVCCLVIIATLHPAASIIQERQARLLASGTPASLEIVMYDPVVQHALAQPPPSKPYKQTCLALALCVACDLADGLRVRAGQHSSFGLFCEGAHELLTAAVATVLYLATRKLGATPSRTLDMACWAATILVALQLQAAAAWERAALAGSTALAFLACAALRTACCSLLAAQGLSGFLGTLYPETPALAASLRQSSDKLRWGAQAAGSLLLLAPPAIKYLISAPSSTFPALHLSALSLGCSRLGVASLTLSSWLHHFPPELSRYGDGLYGDADDVKPPAGGFSSIDEMKAARKAAREARIAQARPPPLLVDSLHRNGGVQSLRCHDLTLCRDPDGDEAHDFWEAIAGGCFRRCAYSFLSSAAAA